MIAWAKSLLSAIMVTDVLTSGILTKKIVRRAAIFFACFTLVLAGFYIAPQAVHASNGSVGGRLVTIYDRGEKKVVLSNGVTIGDALKKANIKLDAHDNVEPGVDTKMVAPSYYVNVYRARPVLVVDGSTRVKVMTAFQTPDQIAKDAGISLYPEDIATLSQIEDQDIVSDGAGLKLTIKRAIPITLDLYSQATPVRTQAATVGDMLREKKIVLTTKDHVVPPLNTPITAGMTVQIWREGKQTITTQEAVPFASQTVQSGDYPLGYQAVQTPGQNGLATVTYEIVLDSSGQIVSKTEIARIVTVQPVTQVQVLGVKLSGTNFSAQSQAIMAAAGIAASDYDYAAYIVNHENGMWCPTRWQGERGCPSDYVPASAGLGPGYGLCQATPGSKMSSAGGDWETNPITQMIWCSGYANSRYGSWQNAYLHWVSYHSW